MKKSHVTLLSLAGLALAALILLPANAEAYERYKDGGDAGQAGTWCATCHGEFTDDTSPKDSFATGGDKHTMHRASGEMNAECDVCHTSGDGRNPYMGSSTGFGGFPGVGCVGCHGREADNQETGLNANPDFPFGRGAGLRQHHTWAGVTDCMSCHLDADPAEYTPVGEERMPAYYGTPGAPKIPATDANGDPTACNLIAADETNENWTNEALPLQYEGTDNDGDGLYDGADPDCVGAAVETDCFDGTDNDGDGDIDCADTDCDGALGAPTTCGVGECSDNTGNLECLGGVEVDTCDPFGGAAPDDSLCDGLDNDCDGATDEDYVTTPTTCGVGECAGNTGNLECQAGAEVDTCDPLAGALPDDQCDGLDNDCDGAADDDYAVTPTTCGVGECAGNTGSLECQAGAEVDTCDPLAGAVPEVCDDTLDNDCDGFTDINDPECQTAEDCFDGTDNDGDGDIDCADADCDGAVGAPTTCGVGECSGNTGNLVCQGGAEVDTCDPFEGAAADDSLCDGLDNDCDGATDEDYVVTPTTCGVGECSGNTGSLTCEGGAEVDSCDPLAGALPDDQCDGLDNDCDGAADDDYVVTPTTCGVGECSGNTGNLECQAGSEVDTCDPLAGALPDDQCDGLDNDCDGAADDDYAVTPTTCGVGECAGNTGSLECQAGAEVDTCDPLAGAVPEVCDDTLDNDCDGFTDINDPECQTAEDCFDGTDNDGDGDIDCADADCDGAVGAPTTCGVGECSGNTGNLVCQGGAEVDTCDPFEGAAADDSLCDGLDNDCDGATDEDYVVTPTTCGVGECAGNTGSLTCEGGAEVDSCDPFAGALPDDQCDGLDNDCDGAADDDYVVTPTTCGVGECAGNTGSLECQAGAEVDTCDPFAGAVPEICDDTLDNDCDGFTDIDDPECQAAEDCFDGTDNDGDGDIDCADADCDGAVGAPTTCGVGECSDNTGNLVCQGGVQVDTCDPFEGAAADDSLCDGLDNDCDGATDEDFVVTPTTCGVGECSGNTGSLTCEGGAEVDSCDPLAGALPDDQCDGLDNDCDGAADDDYVVTPTTCGVGECSGNTGNLECQAGSEVDTCDPFEGAAADDSLCDGLDNDCDGAVDEDFVVTPTTCGVGECAGNTGSLTCEGGAEVDSCDPFAGALPDDQCDGLDNDCDGAADDDYVVTPTTCGVGECAGNTGSLECQGGSEVDTCDPFAGAVPEICDDTFDNDCDGFTDIDDSDCQFAEDCFDGTDNDGDGDIDCADADCDGAVGTPTTCGVGECSDNTGNLVCQGGVQVDTCDPFEGAAADDSLCDGLDNDCDGATDEDYVVTSTACGVGECAGNTGSLTCEGGAEVDSCDPFAGALPDDQCDGLDNDCDGAADDDYVVTPTTCGVGECSGNTGNLECQAGSEVDTCDPFAGAATDDSVCDGLDNDCDGAVDEDYVVTSTTCGLGECSGNTGNLECQGGAEVDTCDPFAGALPEVCDDTLDNDCDGFTDGDDAECVVDEVDLDIRRFKASKKVRVGRSVRLTLVVTNAGTVAEPRRATIIGLVDGMVVTVFDQLVSDAPGDGTTTYKVTYEPTVAGNIVWQAMIFDDDLDVDAATAVTEVRP